MSAADAARPDGDARARGRLGGRRLAVAAAFAALAAFATRDAWADVARIVARDPEQSHVMLVPLVAAWLVWVRRGRLHRFAPGGYWAGPVLVAVGAALAEVGDRRLIQSAWHFGSVLVVVGAFLSVAGGRLIGRFLPAFACLVFLVPVPARLREAVAVPLESATARATQAVLDASGVAVERFGNTLRIGGHDVAVAEACNGLRLAFALMMVTFAFAYGAPLRDGVRALVVLASPVVAVAFNVLRLVPTVWVCGGRSADLAPVVHDVAGWVMLPCAFLALLGLLRLCRWAQFPVTPYVLAHGA